MIAKHQGFQDFYSFAQLVELTVEETVCIYHYETNSQSSEDVMIVGERFASHCQIYLKWNQLTLVGWKNTF